MRGLTSFVLHRESESHLVLLQLAKNKNSKRKATVLSTPSPVDGYYRFLAHIEATALAPGWWPLSFSPYRVCEHDNGMSGSSDVHRSPPFEWLIAPYLLCLSTPTFYATSISSKPLPAQEVTHGRD